MASWLPETGGSSQILVIIFLDMLCLSSSCSPLEMDLFWALKKILLESVVTGIARPENWTPSKFSRCSWTLRKLLSYFSRRA